MKRLPQSVLRSLTWDRGKEMSAHKKFSMATDMAVYFCDPSSLWQRCTDPLNAPELEVALRGHGQPLFLGGTAQDHVRTNHGERFV